MRRFLSILLMVHGLAAVAQRDTAEVQNSTNGWYLSPHGTIRILVLFAEIEYDKTPSNDPQPEATAQWPKGRLPVWKDDLFDAFPIPTPQGMVTKYYHDISLGQYTVLGDYVDRLITIKESEAAQLRSGQSLSGCAIRAAAQQNGLRTAHGLTIADFDRWKEGGRPGLPKATGPDDPHSYDHVMTILRNSVLTHGQGSTDPGSSGKLFGHESDTQSRFGAMNGPPFEILKHEFNHLLLGGNNFHNGGGNAPGFQSYFIALQGGWSMMGAASSSLLTCNAWDRDRLGWVPADAQHRIRARDLSAREVDGDLDPISGDTGVFVLRDFVLTGDALRIRMPYLTAEEYPQWTWLENHQGWKNNGSPTDRFHFEDIMPCVEGIRPGLFAYQQVDREHRTGKGIYGGHADCLRPIPASGNHDLELSTDTTTFRCLWPGPTTPLIERREWADPLSGAHELEVPVFDSNGDGTISRGKEGVVPRILIRDGQVLDNGIFFGNTAQAFTPTGNDKLGLGTNPSLANMATLVTTPGKDTFKGGPPNNRVIHLTGMSVQLLEQRPDGAIVVRVRNDDTVVDRDVRWCGDSIVLHATSATHGRSLFLAEDHRILIDRSRTPTRIDRPEKANGRTYFSDPTRFTVERGARVLLAAGSWLELREGSVLTFLEGSALELDPSARLIVDGSSRIHLRKGARLIATRKQTKKLVRKGTLVVEDR